MNGPYFRGPTGAKHFYTGIAEAIKYVAPELRGKHIYEQLERLDLLEDLTKGSTPFGLPYSFSDYEMQTPQPH